MNTKRHLNLSVPSDIREWVEREAGKRRMTISDFVVQLLVKGIQAETIDETVARIRSETEAVGPREILRQTFAMRFIVETLARGPVRMPTTLSTDANIYADKQMQRYVPCKSE